MEASKCIAMVNSVSPSDPFCSVSARVHIRPKTSLGSCARSNIDFAVSPKEYQHRPDVQLDRRHIPGKTPFCAPDCSKRDVYCMALSVVKGGTRMGPLFWAWRGDALRGGPGGGVIPSNLGRGPPASHVSASMVLCNGK